MRRKIADPRYAFLALILVTACCAVIVPRNGWSKRWGPLVPHKSFPGDCSICHVPERWDVLRSDFAFDHAKETGHPLEGAHADAACLRCHNDFGPVSAYVARGCSGCHLDPHQSRLGKDCRQCHDERSWEPEGLVREHARTRFPLFGAHAATACVLCHKRAPTGDFSGEPTRCEQCHQRDYQNARNPDHVASGFSRDCETCHSPVDWHAVRFSHDSFPLVGGHSRVACNQCHANGVFKGTPTACYACHASDYDRAPDHRASGFPLTCDECHTVNGWDRASIRHDFFPLVLGHAALSCEQCHTGGQLTAIPAQCSSCHLDDYNTAPNHVDSNFPQTCESCHTIAGWEGAAIDHSFFPLAGGHSGLACTRCHTSGQLGKIPAQCSSCHQADFNTAPNHVEFAFPQTCDSCHTIQTWQGAPLNHRFPLTGPHAVSCTTCHTGGGSSAYTCFNCHEHDQARMDDKHRQVNGYVYSSPSCVACHPNGRN